MALLIYMYVTGLLPALALFHEDFAVFPWPVPVLCILLWPLSVPLVIVLMIGAFVRDSYHGE